MKLPKRFIKLFLDSIELEDLTCNKLNNDQLNKLKLLKDYKFSPAGNFGYTKAEVTSGGVCTNEINQINMMSKKVKNLYFMPSIVFLKISRQSQELNKADLFSLYLIRSIKLLIYL